MTKKRKQRGIALLIVVFSLLLVTGIALAMLGNADTETGINQNYRETQQAYFAAQAGIAEAVDRIKLGAASQTNGLTLPTGLPGTGAGNVIYILNKKSSTDTSITPWSLATSSAYGDTEFCKENFGISGVTNNGTGAPCTTIPSGSSWYTSVNSIAPFTQTSGALDYKWVRVTLKGNSSSYPYYTNGGTSAPTLAQVCGDGYGGVATVASGTCSAAGYYPIYVITSLAVTSRGTRRMTQREITNIKLPPFPGALTFDGPAPPSGSGGYIPPYDAPNSNPFHVDGTDHGGCGGASHPAIATVDNTTKTDVVSAIPANRLDHYTGSSGTTPDVQVVSSTTLGNWSTVSGVESVVSMLQSAANPVNVWTNTGSQCVPASGTASNGSCQNLNIGSDTNPQITVVNGDLTMTGSTRGGGILVVTGNLVMSGNSGFYGVVIVAGKGTFQSNGGGNGEFDGTILVAKTRDSSGNLLSTLGEPIVDWSGGGGNGVYYNTCALNNAMNGIGFRTQSTRELLY